MKIETKFEFEDKVWFIFRGQHEEWVPCGFCGATGRITGRDGESDICHKCYGKKGKTIYGQDEWKVDVESFTIGQVEVTKRPEYGDGEDEGLSDVQFSNYGHVRSLYEERYMMRETGIGSGNVYAVDQLFASEEEAHAECDRRNMEAKKHLADTAEDGEK